MSVITRQSNLGILGVVVRLSLVVLFGYALASKLIDPSQLLNPFEHGIGMPSMLAGVMFIVTVLALLVCIVLLLLHRGGAGLAVSGVFFLVGALYSVYLNQHQYQGGCGCSVSIAKGAENELVVHAYQNAASAVLCLFLGFRAGLPRKVVS